MEEVVDTINRDKNTNKVEYRHELKYIISKEQAFDLRFRLRALMKLDSHADNGFYTVHSLYYDNLSDSSLMDKINGVSPRFKYRIRYYNGDLTYINLERKGKIGQLTFKEQMSLTPLDVESLISNDFNAFQNRGSILLHLSEDAKSLGLKPKVIVEYKREPWTYNPGNIRVTIDSCIRTSSMVEDFLVAGNHTIPLQEDIIILEIKYSSYLPSIIQDIVQFNSLQTSYSKYVSSRTLV